MIGYHFLRSDPKCRHPEDAEIVIGKTLRKTRPIVMYRCGYHASKRPMDAFLQASMCNGPICMKVRLGGQMIHAEVESVASERTVLAVCDATEIIREFSRQCVLDVVSAWGAPAAVMKYLETADKELAAGALESIADVWVNGKSGNQVRAFAESRPNLPEIGFVYGAILSGTFPPDFWAYDSFASYATIYMKAQITFGVRPWQPPFARPGARARSVACPDNPISFFVAGRADERLNARLGVMLEAGFAASSACRRSTRRFPSYGRCRSISIWRRTERASVELRGCFTGRGNVCRRLHSAGAIKKPGVSRA